MSGEPQRQQVGQILTADFINPAGLQPKGENLYTETAARGSPHTEPPGSNGFGGLQQGALEGSKVNVVEELVNMIEKQRAYEMNPKAIRSAERSVGKECVSKCIFRRLTYHTHKN